LASETFKCGELEIKTLLCIFVFTDLQSMIDAFKKPNFVDDR
jgi:hypothetical protein